MARAVKLPFSRHWKVNGATKINVQKAVVWSTWQNPLTLIRVLSTPWIAVFILPYLSHIKKKIAQVKDKGVMSGQEWMKYVCLGFCISEASMYKPVVQNRLCKFRKDADSMMKIKGNTFKIDNKKCFLWQAQLQTQSWRYYWSQGLSRLKKWNWRYIYMYENVHSYIQSDETVYSERI